MSNNSEPQKKRRGVLSYTTPLGAFQRASESIAKTKDVLVKRKQDMIAALPHQPEGGQYPEGDLRNIKDPKERFEALFINNNWTADELKIQIKVLRRTKITAFMMSIVGVTGVVAIAIQAPLWMAIILTPAACVCFLLGIAKGFQFALYETQMKLRNLISARDFVGRPDFFNRLIG